MPALPSRVCAVSALFVVVALAGCRESAASGASTIVPDSTARGSWNLTVAPCSSCRVALTRSALLGDSLGDGRLGSSLHDAARARDGRLVVATDDAQGALVFERHGRFLRRIAAPAPPTNAVPLSDSAPGIAALVAFDPADTLHVVFPARQTHLVLDRDYKQVRRVAVPRLTLAWWYGLLLPNDELLMPGTLFDADRIGLPLHVFDSDGNVRQSFGADSVVMGIDRSLRLLAPAGDDRVWVAPLTRYTIERWKIGGRREVAFRRDADWFADYERFEAMHPDHPPKPWLLDVRQDSRGLLWTLVGTADARWKESLVLTRTTPGGRALYDSRAADESYDTIIEVIDPVCRTVLVSQRHPSLLRKLLDDHHVASWEFRQGAVPRLGVWRVAAALPAAGRCGRS